ncbi:hypothetical protein B0I27_108111 [Arcticibacter pallidicorallinus]|uniref:Uncharacterized protein n=1 Tax=Arcticibacter pallidicorallinus TaxID=1259464 RepID=A0A2T0TZ04_9SPHI|nr:hypothetical protein [Arcticibacter pallidicorallinus]PRY50903.1 hypothetical protein B0I27_108111 [Arcticibacter pallidicorallinus]
MTSRITPLNLTSAVLVVILGYTIFGEETNSVGTNVWLVAGILLLSVVSDILFRGILKNLKRIWLIELLFISFVVAMMLIIKQI